MKTVEIEVTQDDIDEGSRHSCFKCPVARAMSRAFGVPVSVDGEDYRERGKGPHGWKPLPQSVARWIGLFDGMDRVEPFKFTVEVE